MRGITPVVDGTFPVVPGSTFKVREDGNTVVVKGGDNYYVTFPV